MARNLVRALFKFNEAEWPSEARFLAALVCEDGDSSGLLSDSDSKMLSLRFPGLVASSVEDVVIWFDSALDQVQEAVDAKQSIEICGGAIKVSVCIDNVLDSPDSISWTDLLSTPECSKSLQFRGINVKISDGVLPKLSAYDNHRASGFKFNIAEVPMNIILGTVFYVEDMFDGYTYAPSQHTALIKRESPMASIDKAVFSQFFPCVDIARASFSIGDLYRQYNQRVRDIIAAIGDRKAVSTRFDSSNVLSLQDVELLRFDAKSKRVFDNWLAPKSIWRASVVMPSLLY